MSRTHVQNQILKRLSNEDYDALASHLRTVDLSLKQNLTTVGEPIEYVYFVERGMVSVIAEVADSESIEVGLIGNEGMTDQVYEAGDSAALRCMVQLSGSALAVEAQHFAAWLNNRPSAMKLVNRYQQAMTIQVSFTALSHGSFTIEERLARWLLMSFDRADENELPLVHNFLAMMLAVRRSGVTTALHVLEGEGAIRASRGKIVLRNRKSLERLAAGCYGFPEREYQRLLGPVPA